MKPIMEGKKYALFGAGLMGRLAYGTICKQKANVIYWIDNSNRLIGTKIFDIPVISIDEYKKLEINDINLLLTFNESKSRHEVEIQLEHEGITEYDIFDKSLLCVHGSGTRLISYCNTVNMEDVILYHVFFDIENGFYVDVGCNDPFVDSVTKLLYDMCGFRGINIDVLKECIELCSNERPYDINLCTAIGSHDGEIVISVNGQGTSAVKNINSSFESRVVSMTTLANVLRKHDVENIHFLKVDVEGMESEVLRGNDWNVYRPWVVLVESTEPGSMIPTWSEWERYLLDQGYHFIYMQGVNRYYVSDEHSDLDEKFLTPWDLSDIYDIWHAVKEERFFDDIKQ